MNKKLQTIIFFKLYLAYLKHTNRPFNLYKRLQNIIKQHNFYFAPTNGTIIYDSLLFWYQDYFAQQYLIKLFLKIKYNIKHYDMIIHRYNAIWAIRRNFFLKNTLSIYPLSEREQSRCFKHYIILRQLLDDVIDKKEDSTLGIISLANQKHSNIFIYNYKKYLHNLLKESCREISTSILKFYVQFLP